MRDLKIIWFDLGYTLVHLNREEVYQQALQNNGINKSIEDISIAYHLADKYFMRHRPWALGENFEVHYDDYYKTLHDYLKIDVNPRYFKHTMKQLEWRAFPEAIPTLSQLKEEGFDIGLISNWDKTARSVLEATGIYDYLDHVVISSEIQIEKPDERIFKYALDTAQVQADESIYIGDNYYDDVIGSRKVGMESILINPYKKLGIEELTDVALILDIKDLLTVLFNRVRQ